MSPPQLEWTSNSSCDTHDGSPWLLLVVISDVLWISPTALPHTCGRGRGGVPMDDSACQRRGSRFRLELTANDRPGLLADVTKKLAESGLMITKAEVSRKGESAVRSHALAASLTQESHTNACVDSSATSCINAQGLRTRCRSQLSLCVPALEGVGRGCLWCHQELHH